MTFAHVLLVSFLILGTAQGSDKHMVCKEIDSIFDTPPTVSGRGIQGPPGKQGKAGVKGEEGVPGSPGRVDYERLAKLVRLEINSHSQQLTERLNEMEEKVSNLTEEIEIIRNESITDACRNIYFGTTYNSTCFWADARTTQDMSLAEGRLICQNKRSRLADIYSKPHYDQLMMFFRPKIIPGAKWLLLWTGMKRNLPTGDAILSDGTTAAFTKPRSDTAKWGEGENTRTHAYLLVSPDANATDQGLGAIWESWNAGGVLCQTI